ncbi:MAG: hypothetical protein RIT81_37415 [Deltaproteobacteria bacterium]
MSRTVEIGKSRRFDVSVQQQDDKVVVRVKAERAEDEAIAEVINTGWIRGPLALVNGARDRVGFSFDRVGVVFQGEAPEEFPRGAANRVRLDYFEDQVELLAPDYAKLVGAIAEAATEGPLKDALTDGEKIRAVAQQLGKAGRRRGVVTD